MIILATTSDVLRVVTTAAVALDVHCSYVDNTTSLYTPNRQNTAISTATTTTVLSAPAASTQRQLKKMTANARGGANTVTVEFFDGTTAFRALSVSLLTGETVEYEDATGWAIHSADGSIKTTGVGGGRLLRARQYLTSGTTITHPTGTATIVVYGVGGGGAGGGANGAGVTAGSLGGMSGSGTYGERTFTAGAASSTFAIGAAGAGASGAAGGAGGNSTFTHNGTTVTLPGGAGGAVTAGAAAIGNAAGGAGGGAATNADFSISGQGGADAIRPAAATVPQFHAGPGGSDPLGMGAKGNFTNTTVVNGGAPTGFGAGGGGQLAGTTTASSAGANGTAGAWIAEEYS